MEDAEIIKLRSILPSILKAQKVFEEFRKNLTTDKDKTATVLAFGFCYELSWELMKSALKLRGIEVASPKEAFRETGLNDLIDAPEVWFNFQEKRELTVHCYEKENLEIIVSIFDNFSKEMEALIARVRAHGMLKVMFNLEPRHLKIVEEILSKYPNTFYTHGLRLRKEKSISVLYLYYKGPMPLSLEKNIEKDFENSDLPFLASLHSWPSLIPEYLKRNQQDRALEADYHERIRKECILGKKGPENAH